MQYREMEWLGQMRQLKLHARSYGQLATALTAWRLAFRGAIELSELGCIIQLYYEEARRSYTGMLRQKKCNTDIYGLPRPQDQTAVYLIYSNIPHTTTMPPCCLTTSLPMRFSQAQHRSCSSPASYVPYQTHRPPPPTSPSHKPSST